jgi:hypothetical protein
MNTILVLNNSTIVRSSVIAQRTGEAMIGVIKAQMIELLKNKLSNGIAHFVFQKKDGSLREAWGTTSPKLAKAKVNGRGDSRELYCTTAYFDVECGAWRSFRWESLVQVF